MTATDRRHVPFAPPEPAGPDGNQPVAPPVALRRRRRRRIRIGAVVVLGLAGGTTLVITGWSSGTPALSTAPSSPVPTDEVRRTDLRRRTTLDGTLGYGTTRTIRAGRTGTVTWLPAVGTVVNRGGAVAAVDGVAVPLLFGELPLYRELAVGAADGRDIRQLEENLVALGHGIDGLVVDDHFDWATRQAVRNWQASLDVEETGAVRPDAAAVAPAAIRVAGHEVEVGERAQPDGSLVTATGTGREVAVELAPAKQRLVAVGDEVEVVLPGGRTTRGTVAAISAAVTADSSGEPGGDGGDPVIPVTITLDDPTAATGLDQAPVSVRTSSTQASDVLTVPVTALLARREGGYAVEVVDDGGGRRLVAVELGAFGDGLVAVTGELRAGQRVVVAA